MNIDHTDISAIAQVVSIISLGIFSLVCMFAVVDIYNEGTVFDQGLLTFLAFGSLFCLVISVNLE